jgi:release factor glutamine methyltransferase
MNIQNSLINAARKLQSAGIQSINLEARILLQHATKKPIEYLLARSDEELPEKQKIIFEELINRRISLEPIAYITGFKEFYGYEFIVNKNVLIPRQDTEIIIEAILDNNGTDSTIKLLDLGTGSGCIAISLLLAMPNAKVIATDISNEAIIIATQNATKHGVSDRLQIINSNWFENLEDQKFDIIVSNPPYISKDEINYIAPETLKYEPNLALFAQDNGLSAYHSIAKDAKKFLKKDGKLFLEIGFNQSQAVKEIFSSYNSPLSKISPAQEFEGDRERKIHLLNVRENPSTGSLPQLPEEVEFKMRSNYIFKQTYKDLAGHDRGLLFSC